LTKWGPIGYIDIAMKTVQIVNITKSITIAERAQIAAGLPERLRGLLGKTHLMPNEALVLKPCSAIHTFFMKFPIDVLFLDQNMHVIRLIQDFLPNRLSPTIWGAKMVVELPAGEIAKTNTSLDDILEFKP